MYLRKLVVNNFRGFEHFEWEIAPGEEAGWHVLLGANGCGKSSLLKAIALAMAGDEQFYALRIPVSHFIRTGTKQASIGLEIVRDRNWDEGMQTKAENQADDGISMSLSLTANRVTSDSALMEESVWSGSPGWFSAAFGPMRRFSGGNPENLKLFSAFPRLARHLSIFGEDVALTESLEWLKELHRKHVEYQREVQQGKHDDFYADMSPMYKRLVRFVNQDGFLPHGTILAKVANDEVIFSDGNGASVPVLDLSDGFRAVLSLTFELIRLMAECYKREDGLFGDKDLTIIAPGIVLIDEIDAHLHPEWQRTIGPTLTKLFPHIQFIVTTHSPYICQNATRGSIWSLPAPGTDQQPKRITGEQLNKVLYGDILQILNSEAFGGMPGRSEAAGVALDRLAELNRLESQGKIDSTQTSERKLLSEKLAPVLANEV